MLPRETLAVAAIPGGDTLTLVRHGTDHVVMLGRDELMGTRMRFSEEQLAELTIAELSTDVPRVLIGGYGMGFTLRAALAGMGQDGRATVVELVPKIIAWARGPMAELAAGCLDDPRVTLIEGDVAAEIAVSRQAYDAILLDVDNGPDGLTAPANDRLYSSACLATAKAALKPGGILAIWSAAPDAAFTRRLRDAGFLVDEVAVKARDNGKGPRHVIWFAQKR